MVDFRPHILKAVISTDEIEDPLTGQIIPGTDTTIEFPCRVSPNGGAKEQRGEDGISVVYGYLIHADKATPKLEFGTSVQVFNEAGQEVAHGNVINSFINSMNHRIWI